MGHDVLRCKFCEADVMEGHNNWECDCGAICDASTNYTWTKKDKKNTIKTIFKNIKKPNLSFLMNKKGN